MDTGDILATGILNSIERTAQNAWTVRTMQLD